MFRYLSFTISLIALSFKLAAQDDNLSPELFKASSIADSLKENTSVVVRYFHRETVVESAKKAVVKEHSLQTLLDEKAEDEAVFQLYYDKKFSAVNSAEMRVYDSQGLLIKRYKKSDFYDRSAVDETSIITDGRILITGHTIVKYPVTVEKIYQMTLNGYLDLPDMGVQNDRVSIENVKCEMKVNPSLGFRYQLKNITQAPVRRTEDGKDVYTWQFKNLKARKSEIGSVWWTYLPQITFATNQIDFDDMPGDISTWRGFGTWIQNLNKNMSELSPERVQEIKKMVAGADSDKEKAKILYNYLQKTTRYVSIQLGIGGLKPFPATFVDQKKYGDCKALTNYMHTLLKSVGIPSYYALVKAGENGEPANTSFVSNPFNHVILCIPFRNDTTWLECTSTTQPFGKLGPFTENRNALLITGDGGKLVNTPKSIAEEHVFESNEAIKIESDGSAVAKVVISSTGEYRDMFIGVAHEKSDDQKEFMIRYLNLKLPDEISLQHLQDSLGTKSLSMDLTYSKFHDMTAGDKYFLKSRLIDLWKETLPTSESRKLDFYFDHPMKKRSTTTYSLSPGLQVESLPADANFKFSFGNYSAKYSYNATKGEVTAVVEFEIKSHKIPADNYAEMKIFMDEIAKSMNKKMILRKKG